MRNLSLFFTLMAAIAIWNLTSCTAGGTASGSYSGYDSVAFSATPSEEAVASYEETISEPVEEIEEKPQINPNWQYRTTEDKLNDTYNYWAEIYSVDGQISCTVAEIGNEYGHYTTVWGVVWNDAYENCYDKRKIGLKVPGDDKWRQIVIDCQGNSGTGDPRTDILINDKVARLLRENKNFSILLGNDEYQFRPNAPLKQQHKEKTTEIKRQRDYPDYPEDAAISKAEAVKDEYFK